MRYHYNDFVICFLLASLILILLSTHISLLNACDIWLEYVKFDFNILIFLFKMFSVRFGLLWRIDSLIGSHAVLCV